MTKTLLFDLPMRLIEEAETVSAIGFLRSH